MKKKQRQLEFYTKRYYSGPRYMLLKSKALSLMMRLGFPFSKTYLRHELKSHAYVMTRLVADFLLEGHISEVRTSGGVFYVYNDRSETGA